MTPHELERLNEAMVDSFDIPNSRPGKPIECAMRALPRHTFLPAGDPSKSYVDDAVVTQRDPVTGEPTSSCSQPSLVATMLYQLDLRPGLRVLEIGTGTGYNAAIAALVVGDPALVWTVDIDDAVSASARETLRIVGLTGVHAHVGDGWQGLPDAAPFDRIIVTAAAQDIPAAWLDQLADGGVLVVPFGHGPFQYSYALRRRGESLAQESRLFCGFMRLRPGSGAGVEAGERAVDPRWSDQQYSRIPGGGCHVADLHQRAAMSHWNATFGPLLNPENKVCYGFYEPRLRASWDVTPEAVFGWGPPGFIEEIAGPIRAWIADGHRSFALGVHPRDQSVALGRDQVRVFGQWLDYVFSPE